MSSFSVSWLKILSKGLFLVPHSKYAEGPGSNLFKIQSSGQVEYLSVSQVCMSGTEAKATDILFQVVKVFLFKKTAKEVQIAFGESQLANIDELASPSLPFALEEFWTRSYVSPLFPEPWKKSSLPFNYPLYYIDTSIPTLASSKF